MRALVAYYRDEAGADTVENLLVAASRRDAPLHMTEVNYAEVKYILIKKNGLERRRRLCPCPVHPAFRSRTCG